MREHLRTVREAAEALGLSPHTGVPWCYEANTFTGRESPSPEAGDVARR